ncbi:type II toxin-antitoxin system RelB/DinJ family antitoxin [Weissella sp. GP1]|uniref:Type II toxin-antitoxin system RelB/DinJ family antitoxin n=1 Tax=Weissella fermenti TaxID=2987699 RepID=A0ABT6D5H8_9LACO|nr:MULTISPECIES: type II toxin-antitoxin system RelB/DinJ family antitoxin [Weissella]MBJ7688485.1 type II toxin-antitoxin system RelB/DinJ family antitoxin [Weissella confusa]MBJ7695486.1 type II toxin-antitoxin system RelB/DinJ family antitoxin [Weissella confusa]MDF9299760.1 type II toxin-antitoxin system RelB/DinJ family antitoxin [Weissella sp. BK2]QBZ05337.1 damage-inducible protein J [Weissella confusa]
MSSTKKNITIKVDESLKHEAEDILDDMGLNMTTLFTMTLKRVVHDRQLPFTPSAQPAPLDEVTKRAVIESYAKEIGLIPDDDITMTPEEFRKRYTDNVRD